MAAHADDNNNNQSMQIPLIENLTNHGVEIIRQLGGFPQNWNPVMISMWLGRYDRVNIEREQLNNGTWSLRTNNDNLFDNIHYIEAEVPLTAFTPHAVAACHRLLLNMEVDDDNWDNWFEYINRGGADRWRIAVRIYNPNVHVFINDNHYHELQHNMDGFNFNNLNIFGNNIPNNDNNQH